ncbi:MAG TPA: SsrA-binding protein SmpB [bacterium]|jgi:SsrA-binding protein|nr:SsrA-binding protein SmpB [bacterium]
MPDKDPAAPLELVASNRAAFHDYFILETHEAGLALKGTEVKSLRAKHCRLKDAHARVDRLGNMELLNFHINPYEYGNRYNTDPTRSRRLLMHKHQIAKLAMAIATKGVTLVPLRVYFKRGRAKVELGLAKGKQAHDKRDTLKAKEADRDIRREMGRNLKGRL